MAEILNFVSYYGWQLGLIAFIGIVILGVLKYANVFGSIEKEKRKPIYFGITVGFSLIATLIYLAIINQFNVDYIVTVTAAIYALNQTMYAVYENTKLRDLVVIVITWIFDRFKKDED